MRLGQHRVSKIFGTSAVLVLLAASFCPLNRLSAQSGQPGADTLVDKLYEEAQSAEARGDTAAEIKKYEAILKLAPRAAEVYYNLGALYAREQQYPQAAAVLQQGLALDPKLSPARELLGITLYHMGEYEKARPVLEAAVRANPKDYDEDLFLASDLIQLKEFKLAESQLRHVVEADPKNQQAWFLLGSLYVDLSNQSFSKLDEIDPNSAYAHEVKGDAMAARKAYDGALAEYQKAVEMAPQEPGTHYRLGNTYWVLSDWVKATQEFQSELANDPSNCAARWKLGNMLLTQHDNPEQALADVDQAISLCPDLTQARTDKGRALVMLNRYAEALPVLEEAAKAAPDDSSVHFLLAQAYRGLGKTQEAQGEMEILAKLDEIARTAEAAQAQGGVKNSPETSPKTSQ